MDLSEDVSQTNTITDDFTEARSKMTTGAIHEEATSEQQPNILASGFGTKVASPVAQAAPAMYNDFLGKQ